MENYLTVRELAVKIQFTEQTVYRYVMRGKIPFHKIGRAVRFRPSEVELWIAEREQGKALESGKAQGGGLFAETEAARTTVESGEKETEGAQA